MRPVWLAGRGGGIGIEREAQIEYRRKRQRENFSGIQLEIESLASLDQTIDELFAALERGGNPELLEKLCPYFGTVWPAARALSEYLVETSSQRLFGKSVFEIGCGLAVPSLVCARLGAHVTATDFHPDILSFLKPNLEMNHLSGVLYREVDWMNFDSRNQRYDWVIGSDILYERTHPEGVVRTLLSYSNPGGRIVVSDPGRPYLQGFIDEMKKAGLEPDMTTKNVADPDRNRRVDVFVFDFLNTNN